MRFSDKTPPGFLRPALEPSAQERHGPVGVGPEEGHKNDPRGGTPLLQGKAERAGVVQFAEEKPPARPYCGPFTGLIRKLGTNILAGPVAIGQRYHGRKCSFERKTENGNSSYTDNLTKKLFSVQWSDICRLTVTYMIKFSSVRPSQDRAIFTS